MSPAASRAFFRTAARTPYGFFKSTYTMRPPMSAFAIASGPVIVAASQFSTTSRLASGHEEESFDEFNSRYEKEFEGVQDVFELQRNLNNAFAYDLVPTVGVMTAAIKAARRVNDFPTAVRIFEGIQAKVEQKQQYEEYLNELKPLREELGIPLKEELYPSEEK